MAFIKKDWDETTPITPAELDRMETQYDEAINWAKGFGLGSAAFDVSTWDLNTLDPTGFYKGVNMLNSPSVPDWFYIINIKHDSSYKVQMALRLSGRTVADVHTRILNGGTWGAWTEQETTAGAQAKADQAEQDAKDWAYLLNGDRILDTRATNELPSYYYAIANRTHHEFKDGAAINAPLSHYGILVTLCPWTDASGGTVKQTFYSSDTVYTRFSTNATTWGPWQQLETTAGAQAKADQAEVNAKAYAVKVGTTNADITEIKALFLDTDTRGLHIVTRNTAGKITKAEERDGATVKRTWNITRNATDDKIDSIQEIANGKTITHTINRGADRKITSVTKTVV